MNTPAKVATFALGLAAAFGAALGVGAAVGPVDDPAPAMAGHGGDAHGEETTSAEALLPAGLAVSTDGFTLALDSAEAPAGPATPVSFRVLDADGSAVTDFAVAHEQRLHLIAVRRDLSGYQHVHPTLAADGTWTTSLSLTPGSWRLIADSEPEGAEGSVVLGADLAVPGEHSPVPLPAPAHTAEVDGYTVALSGDLTAGQETELTLTVSRDGVPVTDLQPYLGAAGHLVVLRAGDLGYLHVHPVDEGASGPDVAFATTAPAAGTYRLFLDFRHGDVVRTAEFTVEATRG
ncbi:hypothetical protein, partial [Blastococcus sp. URHD0036]|uniref:hypothetical protein n=1 Tax=Blastococcus sp. URHD0036 TaxID=1380356 RepID=UPI000495302F